MLTNLDWIATGAKFPPEDEERRLKRYKEDSDLFKGKTLKVYGDELSLWASSLHMKDVDIQIAIKYPQLLTKKTADFVCGEPVNVDAGDDTDKVVKRLEVVEFNDTLYESIMDVSRFGNAVLKILDNRISIIPPKNWFPIVDEFDKKHIINQVIAFRTEKSIYVEIHYEGYYIRRTYAIVDDVRDEGFCRFGQLLKEETVQTNIDDFAVQVLSNVTDSESLYGVSDYDVIKDVHCELVWRLFCLKRILDKHSAPSLLGNSTMLTTDPVTGREYVRMGNFFVRDTDSIPKPEYLTWDGNVEAVKWHIDYLTNQMYTLSEMGAAFLEGAGKGEVNSGRALKLRMTSPLIKAQRITGKNNTVVKKIIKICSLAGGINIPLEQIALTWNDGLPNDERDVAEMLNIATSGKPFMSQSAAIKRFMGLSDEETQNQVDLIAVENV